MPDLGVYVTCVNEENLIKVNVEAVRRVFPQVEVIDLGSTDDTQFVLDRLGVTTHFEGQMDGAKYTQLKNDFSTKHDWVLWVDGDEVWPEESLNRLKGNWKANLHRLTALRIAWRYLVVVDGEIYESESLVNGPKMFNVKVHSFVHPWPYETTNGSKDTRQPRKHAGRQWCWHGKMLNRSSKSESSREEKREDYYTSFHDHHKNVTWKRLSRLPFKAPPEVLDRETDRSFIHGLS